MRLFSKGFPFLLFILIVTLLISSCSLPGPLPTVTPTPDWTATPLPPTATPTPTLTPTPTETPIPEYLSIPQEELENMTIILRHSLDGKVREKIEELAARFNDENTYGITVQVIPAYSMDELSGFITGDSAEKTDIVIAGSAWLRSENSSGEYLAALNEFMDVPELALDTDAIMPVMLVQEDQDGQYNALPVWAEPAFLFYNKTWAIELGFEDTPTDLAAFAEQACAAGKASYNEKDDGKHGTGGWIVSSDPEDVLSWLLIFAQKGQTPGTILRGDSGDVFSDAAAWLRNLFDNGCAWNSRVKEPYDYFANRYALFYSGTYSDAERQFNAFEQSSEHNFDNWDLIVYPSRTVGKNEDPRIYGEIVSATILNGEAKAMSAAWQFIRWLYADEHAAELALAAGAWPVQDNDAVTKMYRNSGEDKLYQTLSYRQYLVNNDADENWLTDRLILSDGFAYIFNPSIRADDISGIWEQVNSSIAEVNAASGTIETYQSEEQITGGNDEK